VLKDSNEVKGECPPKLLIMTPHTNKDMLAYLLISYLKKHCGKSFFIQLQEVGLWQREITAKTVDKVTPTKTKID